MPPLTLSQLREVMHGADETRCAEFLPALQRALDAWEIDTPERVAAFLAQAAHESDDLTRLEESLNYNAERLCAIWPRRFPSLDEAMPYHRNPERIANRVYGGRLGNGDEASGDGWRYRGRGIFQLTGAANYGEASLAIAGSREVLLGAPELVARPQYACATAAWFWDTHACNELADAGDFAAITKKINGGMIGLDQRVACWKRAIGALA
jgi:putative chitinase